MDNTLQITVKLFGSFRNFSKYFNGSNQLALQLTSPCTIAEIRDEFHRKLQLSCPDYNEKLLAFSLFANDEAILPETTQINETMELSIIPPVSGG